MKPNKQGLLDEMDIEPNETMNIKIRSLFYGWRFISKEDALSYAKYKIGAIATCENDEERLVLINKRFQGISFKLDELK
jgi:hypothetical protein